MRVQGFLKRVHLPEVSTIFSSLQVLQLGKAMVQRLQLPQLLLEFWQAQFAKVEIQALVLIQFPCLCPSPSFLSSFPSSISLYPFPCPYPCLFPFFSFLAFFFSFSNSLFSCFSLSFSTASLSLSFSLSFAFSASFSFALSSSCFRRSLSWVRRTSAFLISSSFCSFSRLSFSFSLSLSCSNSFSLSLSFSSSFCCFSGSTSGLFSLLIGNVGTA